MGSTNGKLLGFDEGIKLVLSGGKVLVTIVGSVDVITPGIDFVTKLGSLGRFFDGSNANNIE